MRKGNILAQNNSWRVVDFSSDTFLAQSCLGKFLIYCVRNSCNLGCKFQSYKTGTKFACKAFKGNDCSVIAAAASEPEANERGSSLISRRLHYRGLQSLFLTKRKELWLCANGRFRMRSGMRKELWLCANGNILGCAVIWGKELWLCANG